MPRIVFQMASEELTFDVGRDTTILDVALDHDIELDHNCGGNCACTTCHVIVQKGMDNLSPMQEDEEDRLDTAEGLTLTSRLACQARILGDVVVEIPKETQPFRKAEQH